MEQAKCQKFLQYFTEKINPASCSVKVHDGLPWGLPWKSSVGSIKAGGPPGRVHHAEPKVHRTASTNQGPPNRVGSANRSTKPGPPTKVHQPGSTKQGPPSRVQRAGSPNRARVHQTGSTKQGPPNKVHPTASSAWSSVGSSVDVFRGSCG